MAKAKYSRYILDKQFIGISVKESKGDVEEEIETIIYPFEINPIESKESEDSILMCEIDNKIIEFDSSNLISLKEFRKKIGTLGIKYQVWFGGEGEFKVFANKIMSKKIRTTQYLKLSGYHKIDDKWCFACNGGLINKNEIDLNYSTNKEIKDTFIKNGPINDKELEIIKHSLLNYNEKGIVASHLGYITSLFLREILYVDLNLKSPCLSNFGNPGSGKTETLNQILIPILNLDKDIKLSAKSVTPFSLLHKLCESNFFPVIIDDLKSNVMSINKIDLLIGKINESYDRPTIERGNVLQQTKKWPIKASIILSGESNTLDTSNNDRIVNSILCKTETMKHTEEFKVLFNNEDLLRKLGKKILLNSLNIDKKTLSSLYDENRTFIEKNSINLSTRMVQSLAITCVGLDFLEMNIGKIPMLTEYKLQMISTFIESTLDYEGKIKDTTSIILEEISNLAYQKLINGMFSKITMKKYNKEVLALDLKLIFDMLDKYNISIGKKSKLDYSPFAKLIKKENYYLGYETVNLKGESENKRRKCFIFDIENLQNLGLELDGLGIISYEEIEHEGKIIDNSNIVDFENKKNQQQKLV